MIHPAPTTPIAPSLARGTLAEIVPPTATQPEGFIIIEFPNTNYRLHLIPTSMIQTQVGKRIIGAIEAKARRVDVVQTGGNYVEPVYGRPRRVQGRVIGADPAAHTITVDAGMPIRLVLTDRRQTPEQFKHGDLVSCDVLEGATFTPAP